MLTRIMIHIQENFLRNFYYYGIEAIVRIVASIAWRRFALAECCWFAL